MNKLERLRAAIAARDSRENGNSGTSNRKSSQYYRFFDIKPNETCVVRFLEDGDPEKLDFWAERQTITLPFPGIKGQDESKEVKVFVPCIEMYGEDYKNKCPIHTDLRALYKTKDPEDEKLAQLYWKSYSYFFQGFVVDSPLVESEDENNPLPKIRIFKMGKQIFNIIKSAIMDPDFENLPYDHFEGYNFNIKKLTKGKQFDYTTSQYSRKSTPLSAEQLDAITNEGLKNLNDLLPAIPTAEHLDAMYEMFQASLAGELYDPELWSNFYKPYGLKADGASNETDEGDDNESNVPTQRAKAPVVNNTTNDDKINFDSKEPANDTSTTVEPVVQDSKSKARELLERAKARANKV